MIDTLPSPMRATSAHTPDAAIARWIHWSVLIAFALLIGAFAIAMLRYSLGPFSALFNSDDAASVLYGHEMLVQHSLLPQWNNATGVMFAPIMPHVLFEPLLLSVMQDWFRADRIAVALDQALMFGLIWWVLGRAGLSRVARAFLVALLLIGPSWLFWDQTTLLAGKSWSYTFTLLLSWLALRVADSPSARDLPRRMAPLLLCGGLVFVDLANAATLLPGLCVALGAEALGRRDRRHALTVGGAFLGLCGTVVVGRLLFHGLLSHDTYSTMSVPFLHPSETGRNLFALAIGLPMLFGAVPPTGTSPYAAAAAAAGAKFVLLLIALATPVYLSLRHDILVNRYARLLAVACSVSLLLRLYIFTFTDISTGSIGATRYFITDLLIGVTVTLFYLEQRFAARWFKEPLMLAAIIPFAITPAARDTMTSATSRHSEALTQALLQTGVSHGYASFWNANVVTALSNGAIAMAQVNFENGGIAPFAWLSSDRWFHGETDVKRSLLVMDGRERTLRLPLLESAAGQPERSIELGGGYVAQVYPFDLAERLGWSQPMNVVLAAEDMRARISVASPPTIDRSTQTLVTRWHVRNLGHALFTSYGRYPVHLGVHSLKADGSMLDFDLARATLPALAAQADVDIETRIPLRSLQGATQIEADLVQEGVAWFASPDSMSARVEIPREPAAPATALRN